MTDELEALRDEVQRHRNANLLRLVLNGSDVLDEAVTEAVNAEDFDRVPWLVALRFRADAERLRESLAAVMACGCGPDCASRCRHVSGKDCTGCEAIEVRARAALTDRSGTISIDDEGVYRCSLHGVLIGVGRSRPVTDVHCEACAMTPKHGAGACRPGLVE